MKAAVSLWPSQLKAGDGCEGASMQARVTPSPARALQSAAFTLLALLLSLVAAATAGWEFGTAKSSPLPCAVLAAAVAAGVIASLVRRRSRSIAARGFDELVFRRNGIAMWREDWSVAAAAVASLRARGVTDLESYFANDPAALRSLRARVMIKDVNDRAVVEAQASRREEMLGSLDQLLPDTDQTFVQWLAAIARGDRHFRSQAHVTDPSGKVRETLFAATLPADLDQFDDLIVSAIDVTDYEISRDGLLRAESEMTRGARITTIGALTASIAHEVNGPLAAILANAEAALRFMRAPHPQMEEVEEALVALLEDASRATEVVERTRAFITRSEPEHVPIDVVACLRQANSFVERDLRSHGATTHINAAPVLPLALGDPVQLQQIFVNLLLNAAQAMAGSAAARDIRIDLLARGPSIHIDVIDTGPGVSPDHVQRIFDPFFSTRDGGMGMGLAIARASAEAQGGRLIVENRPAGGAVFHLVMPTARL